MAKGAVPFMQNVLHLCNFPSVSIVANIWTFPVFLTSYFLLSSHWQWLDHSGKIFHYLKAHNYKVELLFQPTKVTEPDSFSLNFIPQSKVSVNKIENIKLNRIIKYKLPPAEYGNLCWLAFQISFLIRMCLFGLIRQDGGIANFGASIKEFSFPNQRILIH